MEILLYKYFAYNEADSLFFKPHQFLSEMQLKIVLKDMLSYYPMAYNLYYTIQDYNQKGTCLGSKLFFDFDGHTSLNDSRLTFNKLKDMGLEVRAYFSGNKGFHLLSNLYFEGENCHKHIAHFVTKLGLDTPSLDMNVYTNRRLFRVAGSYNTKGKLFKLPLTEHEFRTSDIDRIHTLANIKRYDATAWSKVNDTTMSSLRSLLDEVADQVAKETNKSDLAGTDFGKHFTPVEAINHMTPCLRTFLTDPLPLSVRGDGNVIIYLLARYFKSVLLTFEEAVNCLMSFGHFADREEAEKDVIRVVRSVYEGHHFHAVGCKTGHVERVMTKYCDALCIYNTKDEVWFKMPEREEFVPDDNARSDTQSTQATSPVKTTNSVRSNKAIKKTTQGQIW